MTTHYYLRKGYEIVSPNKKSGERMVSAVQKPPYIFTEADLAGTEFQRRRWIHKKLEKEMIGVLTDNPSPQETILISESGISMRDLQSHLQARNANSSGEGQPQQTGTVGQVKMIPGAGDMAVEDLRQAVRNARPDLAGSEDFAEWLDKAEKDVIVTFCNEKLLVPAQS